MAAIGALRYETQVLDLTLATDGDNHPAAGFELRYESRRHARRGGSHDDRVEGSFLRPALVAVADAHFNVAVTEFLEAHGSAIREKSDDLDGKDARGDLAKHRGLV